MHTNMSLFKNGKNVFYDPDGEKGLIQGGEQLHCRAAGPCQGHVRRNQPPGQFLQAPGAWLRGPLLPAWSASNRSALIRIPPPAVSPPAWNCARPTPPATPIWSWLSCWPLAWTASRRVWFPRLRSPRISSRWTTTPRRAGIDSLPGSLEEAIKGMQADPMVLETLGGHVSENYIEGKAKEWDEYRTRVSSWEREKYIINY